MAENNIPATSMHHGLSGAVELQHDVTCGRNVVVVEAPLLTQYRV
jgi:hypothetical protein